MKRRFADRTDAGRELSDRLRAYGGRSDVIVLALPRGGVPVAAEVAKRLGAPLDLVLVRKLGVPGNPELAMGAIAEGDVEVLDTRLIRELQIPRTLVDQVAAREHLELDRRDRDYRGRRPVPHVANRTVILVDDGLATGATMEAALTAVKARGAAAVVAASPIGARHTCTRLRRLADEVVCVETPDSLGAVGAWYADFAPPTDDEVRRLVAGEPVAAPPRATDARGDAVDLVRRRGVPLDGGSHQYDRLVAALGRARVILIGEATHGTHEFYRERAMLTRRLIEEHGVRAVAVEADWPDAYRVNRYVRGIRGDADAAEALSDFQRFPTWMWRNADVVDFVGWLRSFNDARPAEFRVGFYGLDLYGLHASMRAVITYLDKVDAAAAARARTRYACFDRFGEEMQDYAYSARLGIEASCEREVVSQLVELRRRAADYARLDGRLAADEYFVAEQNARVVRNAEAYYRTMLGGRVESWNLRDRHMAGTVEQLSRFLAEDGPGGRLVLWAHNSHVGDARATEPGSRGELTLGQLVRERLGIDAVSVGFTTYDGTVTAAVDWDGPAYRRHVRPALAASHERLLHDAGVPRVLLPFREDLDLASIFAASRLERAIGVLYRPETERPSHYFHASLSKQFDYVIHIDRTRAVEPLERTPVWASFEPVETFPSGL